MSNFCLENRFFFKLPEKISVSKICLENRIFGIGEDSCRHPPPLSRPGTDTVYCLSECKQWSSIQLVVLSVCLSLSLSASVSLYVSSCLTVSLSLCLSVSVSLSLSGCLSVDSPRSCLSVSVCHL